MPKKDEKIVGNYSLSSCDSIVNACKFVKWILPCLQQVNVDNDDEDERDDSDFVNTVNEMTDCFYKCFELLLDPVIDTKDGAVRITSSSRWCDAFTAVTDVLNQIISAPLVQLRQSFLSNLLTYVGKFLSKIDHVLVCPSGDSNFEKSNNHVRTKHCNNLLEHSKKIHESLLTLLTAVVSHPIGFMKAHQLDINQEHPFCAATKLLTRYWQTSSPSSFVDIFFSSNK